MARVQIELIVDESGAIRGIESTGEGMQTLQRETEETESRMMSVGRTLETAFGFIIANVIQRVAASMRGFVQDIFDTSIAIDETRSKFTSVFQDMTDEADRFVEAWAHAAGMTRREGQEFLATSAAMARSMGLALDASTEFAMVHARLVRDLAVAANVELQESERAIQDLMLGRVSSINRLGIAMRRQDVQQRALVNTGKENVQELEQVEIATAGLQLVSERMTDTFGEMDSEQRSAAWQLNETRAVVKQFKEDLAEALFPVIERGIEVVGNFIEQNQHLLNALLVLIADGFVDFINILVRTGDETVETERRMSFFGRTIQWLIEGVWLLRRAHMQASIGVAHLNLSYARLRRTLAFTERAKNRYEIQVGVLERTIERLNERLEDEIERQQDLRNELEEGRGPREQLSVDLDDIILRFFQGSEEGRKFAISLGWIKDKIQEMRGDMEEFIRLQERLEGLESDERHWREIQALEALAEKYPQVADEIEKMIERYRELGEVQRDGQDELLHYGRLISQTLTSVSEEVGRAIGDMQTGVRDIGPAILDVFLRMAGQIGQILIGIGVGARSLDPKTLFSNPWMTIAAGLTLVALSRAGRAAISASIERNTGMGTGTGPRHEAGIHAGVSVPPAAGAGVAGSVAGIQSFRDLLDGIEWEAHTEIDGESIRVVTRKTNQRRKRLGLDD